MSKILYLDIETSYMLAKVWQPGNQYISHKQLINHTSILCAAWKWEGEKVIHSHFVQPVWLCDKELTAKLVEVINQADLVIGQNHEAFDLKVINARAAYHGIQGLNLNAISTDDTLKLMRKAFRLPSCSMEYAAQYFGLTLKTDGGGMDRVDRILRHCEDTSSKAMKEHVRYCRNDVKVTEELMQRIMPYVNLKVNRALLSGGDVYNCHACGSENVHQSDNYYYTKVSKYAKFTCGDCMHHWKVMRKVKE